MDLWLFGSKNVFFEKTDDRKKENNGPNQTQEKNCNAPVWKKLIQQKVFWDDHED